MLTTLLIIFWIAAGVLHYGLSVGHFQNKYPLSARDDFIIDRIFSLVMSLFGPCAIFGFVVMRATSGTVSPNPPLVWKL